MKKKKDNERAVQLIESIVVNGIITPLIVRKIDDDLYEIISGHRRKYVAELLNMQKVPCIVKEMNDNEAILAMVDCNIDRENILPSERALSYKMRLKEYTNQQIEKIICKLLERYFNHRRKLC